MAEDFYSFEDVMKELAVDEDELKRMVSEGELRAYRSENKMKFKADDVENLKKGRVSEPTVILPSTPTPPAGIPAVDETALELDLESELGALTSKDAQAETQPGFAPEQPSDALVFEESSAAPGQPETAAFKAPDETFAEEEEVSIAPNTEPLKFADEPQVVTDEVTVEAPVAQEEAVAAPRRAGAGRARRAAPTQVPAYVEEQIEKRRAHWIWSVVMTFSMIATVAYLLLGYEVLRHSTGKIQKPSKLTDGVVKWTLNKFWEDPEWVQFHLDEMPLEDPMNEESERKLPHFHKYHRDYPGPSYKEPRKAIPLEELEVIREQIRLEEEGAQEEPPPNEGGEG